MLCSSGGLSINNNIITYVERSRDIEYLLLNDMLKDFSRGVSSKIQGFYQSMALALWHYGTMALWHYGTMALWPYSLVSFHYENLEYEFGNVFD